MATMSGKKTMRDALIARVHEAMATDERIFFLSADMGAPVLDHIRADFKDRFINVGIAEQNLVNVAAGLAHEGWTVYALAIAPFYLRAYEQIRINLSLAQHLRPMNVTMLGVGVGVSYDVSGPTHHCLEDISAMRVLPRLTVCSPADWVTSHAFYETTRDVASPKYLRCDSKPNEAIYTDTDMLDFTKGFHELIQGERVCLVTTGYMTQKALRTLDGLKDPSIGLVDLYMLTEGLNEAALFETLSRYDRIITLEEAFTNRGGIDSLVSNLLHNNHSTIPMERFGFDNQYHFKFGTRDYLHDLAGFGDKPLVDALSRNMADVAAARAM
ncbi:transketolase family protein [Magnetofaba australis]|uniref:Putative transketolase central region n=1 Tax=Magnetofaba australis IT-1 TaxID=1434232 RepID=A0A1Y2K6B1_9PROT|nr:transketolase C-terminal domain-containing protein [Magnetofaba australis]OSM05201.1 putative transketolase central region [Magnetofaba australis IT-1]